MGNSVRLKDIAEELGVSVTTISKAINNHPDISDERKAQIMELLDERGYVPNYTAKNLRQQHTKFIGVVISDNSNPYFADVLKGAEAVLSKNGFFTLLFNNNEDVRMEIMLIRELLGINVRGVLLTPACSNAKSAAMLRGRNVPYVLINRYINRDSDCYVVADDEKAGYIATEHLLKRHNRPVAMITASMNISTVIDRRNGFLQALQDANVPFREDLLVSNCFTPEDAYTATKKIVEKSSGKLNILCYSDHIATGVLKCLHEMNLAVPDDVAVMGIDGIKMFGAFSPGLSTIYLPKYSLGEKSAELLLSMIRQPNKIFQNKIMFEPQLIQRDTT